MIEVLYFFFLAAIVSPPLTGVAARLFGRPFFKWALIGLVLPGIALLLLYWVTRNDEQEKPAAPPSEAS